MFRSKTEIWQKAIDANPELIRIGKPWSKEEEQNLLNRISEGKSINDISVEFKRAQGGIKARLKKIAVKMLSDGKSIIEVSKLTGIKHNDLQQSATSHKIQIEEEPSVKRNYKNDISEILSLTRDIHSMMKEFVAVRPPVIIKKIVKPGCLVQDD